MCNLCGIHWNTLNQLGQYPTFQEAIFVDLLDLCLKVWDEGGSSPAFTSSPVSPAGWL